VQQDHGRPFTLFEVMEPDAVNVDELTLGWVPSLHPAGLVDVETAAAASAAAVMPRIAPERGLRAR
jgi:hypothetical protein